MDEGERIVRVADGADGGGERMLPYDQCIVALGAQPTFSGVPGAEEYAQPFYSAADAMAVKAKVQELRENAERSVLRVCVVGGGYIGAELAANLCAHPLQITRTRTPSRHIASLCLRVRP